MCWKDMMKKYQRLIFVGGVFVVLMIAAFLTLNFIPLFNPNDLIKTDSATDIIAIITVSALILGFLMYIGNITAMKNKYRLLEVRLGLKEYMIAVGSVFLVVVAAVYFSAKQNQNLLNLLYYIAEMGALAFFLGLTLILKPDDNKKVALKMIACNEAGGKEVVTRTNLELYQITGTDYRFKDSNGKEFIIPTGLIQEIETED